MEFIERELDDRQCDENGSIAWPIALISSIVRHGSALFVQFEKSLKQNHVSTTELGGGGGGGGGG